MGVAHGGAQKLAGIPEDLDLNSLPGPERGEHPALYFRDEAIWSPDDSHFALAYTITEASMGNDVGRMAWGALDADGRAELTVVDGILASCWRSPWCLWLENHQFLFKAQVADLTANRTHVPLVMFDLRGRFGVLSKSDTPDSWPTDPNLQSPPLEPFSVEAYRKAVLGAG